MRLAPWARRAFTGYESYRSAINQRLSAVAWVHCDKAKRSGNSALVSARINPVNYSLQNPPCRQQLLSFILIPEKTGFIIWVRNAESVNIRNRLCAESEPKRVAIHADNRRHRTAEGVKRRGVIMRLHLVPDDIIV